MKEETKIGRRMDQTNILNNFQRQMIYFHFLSISPLLLWSKSHPLIKSSFHSFFSSIWSPFTPLVPLSSRSRARTLPTFHLRISFLYFCHLNPKVPIFSKTDTVQVPVGNPNPPTPLQTRCPIT